MKKILCILLSMVMLLAGCGKKSKGNEAEQIGKKAEDQIQSLTESSAQSLTIEELKEIVMKDIQDTVAQLQKDKTALVNEIDSFKAYQSKSDKVESYYAEIYEVSKRLSVRMREYGVIFAKKVLDSDSSFDDKYDEIDVIIDFLYGDASDEINERIYDDLLDEMHKAFYDGVLDERPDDVSYEIWTDVYRKEYEMWDDTAEKVYRDWSDSCSDIYDLWDDVSMEIYREDMSAAQEKVESFQEKISKLK